MSGTPSVTNRLRLQIVVASENAEGQLTDLRKFLHITQQEKNIFTFITEVSEKFKSLYPTERYPLIDT
jgi:Cdc14 phosphatase binding protein N-terminus